MHPPSGMNIDKDFKSNAQTIASYKFTVCWLHMKPRFADFFAIFFFAAKFKSNRQMTTIAHSYIARIWLIELYNIEINVRLFHRYLQWKWEEEKKNNKKCLKKVNLIKLKINMTLIHSLPIKLY